MKDRVQRTFAIFGAVLLLVIGLDAVSYAATGKSFLLGASNSEAKTTTLKNIGAGAALSLQTKSTTSAPLVTNGRGLVKNLNAEMVGGLNSNQLQAAAIDPMTFTFKRTNAATAPLQLSTISWPAVIEANLGAQNLTYRVTGSVQFACAPAAAAVDSYGIGIITADSSGIPVSAPAQKVPGSDCGNAVHINPAQIAMSPTTHLIIIVVGRSNGQVSYDAPSISVNLVGQPVRADL